MLFFFLSSFSKRKIMFNIWITDYCYIILCYYALLCFCVLFSESFFKNIAEPKMYPSVNFFFMFLWITEQMTDDLGRIKTFFSFFYFIHLISLFHINYKCHYVSFHIKYISICHSFQYDTLNNNWAIYFIFTCLSVQYPEMYISIQFMWRQRTERRRVYEKEASGIFLISPYFQLKNLFMYI